MLRVTGWIGIAAAMLLVASGCTWQQAYSAGQAWQRNVCNRLVEQSERERCLDKTTMTYEDYRRQVDGTKKDQACVPERQTWQRPIRRPLQICAVCQGRQRKAPR